MTGLSPTEGATPDRTTAARATRGAILYYLAALAVLHLADTGLDPVERPVSSYLNTAWRPLATTTFLALSAAIFSAIFALRASTRPGLLRGIASGLYGVVSAGIILAGLTPTALSPLSDRLHTAGALLTFPPLLVATPLWTVALLRAGVAGPARWLLPLLAAGLVLALPIGVTVGESLGAGGLFQRGLFACLVGWLWAATGVRPVRVPWPPARRR